LIHSFYLHILQKQKIMEELILILELKLDCFQEMWFTEEIQKLHLQICMELSFSCIL